jgi:hypothetical protein
VHAIDLYCIERPNFTVAGLRNTFVGSVDHQFDGCPDVLSGCCSIVSHAWNLLKTCNTQAVVDAESLLVLHVTDAVNDKEQVAPMILEIGEPGEHQLRFVADNGMRVIQVHLAPGNAQDTKAICFQGVILTAYRRQRRVIHGTLEPGTFCFVVRITTILVTIANTRISMTISGYCKHWQQDVPDTTNKLSCGNTTGR